MKNLKRSAALLLAAALVFAMTACRSFSEDMTTLVRGNLDELYLGQYDADYIKLVRTTEEDCEKDYLDGLELEAEFFASYFQIENLTDDLKAEIVELYKELYSHSEFTVGEASKLDDSTYAVKVEIAPINIVNLIDENWEEGMADFYEKYADQDPSEMTDEEYNAFDADWAHGILQLFRDQLPEIGHMDAESIAVQVVKNDDGVWRIADSDMGKIDELIIYYP